MAKFTAIVNAETGEIIGGSHGHVGHPPGTEGLEGGLLAGPGQRLEHIEIPDSLAAIEDPADFHARLREHYAR